MDSGPRPPPARAPACGPASPRMLRELLVASAPEGPREDRPSPALGAAGGMPLVAVLWQHNSSEKEHKQGQDRVSLCVLLAFAE